MSLPSITLCQTATPKEKKEKKRKKRGEGGGKKLARWLTLHISRLSWKGEGKGKKGKGEKVRRCPGILEKYAH